MAKQVLIVDDEETLTWSLAKSLSHDRESYEVTTVNDGEAAMSTFMAKPFDLVVLDIRMPGINGLDVLTKIKDMRPSTKVIIMTAFGSMDIKAEAKSRGSLFYIEKPFEIDHMRSLILKALKQETDRGFNGSMTGLQLPDIIQMNCLSQITTALYVTKDQREGVIYFEDGQITHAQIEALEGEEALFAILSWQSGSFKFAGGQKAPVISINSNWEYLLIEGMRKADEMSLALEQGDVDDTDIAPIDEQTRLMVKNISSLNECKGLAVLNTDGDFIHKSGQIGDSISYVTRFFMNISDEITDIVPITPEKISFIDQNCLTMVFPFRIYILVLYFDRAVLSPDTSATIERVISRYKA